MITLREFAYYDRRKIEDFFSIIKGGISRQSKETTKQIGKEFEGGVPNIIKGKTGHTEIERQELLEITDALLFDRLYNAFIEENIIKKFENVDNILKQLKIGDLLEINSVISISNIEKFFENYHKSISTIKSMPSYKSNPEKFDNIINFINSIVSREISNILIKPLNNNHENIFVSSLIRNNITVSTKTEIEGNYFILARIKSFLKGNQTFKLFEYLPGINMDENIILKIIESFQKPGFGFKPSRADLEIKAPAIILTPIAIYR
jgi:hypothetical protein